MPEPDLIQRQREILRAFRQATAQRAKVEADAEAQRRAERETADQLLHKAQQEAQTQRTTAEAGAEARRKSEQQAAGTALKYAQNTAASQLAAARDAREKTHAALSQAGLQHLLEQTRPALLTPRPDAEPAQELALCASVATEASTRIPDTVETLKQWREAAARRRQRLATIAIVAVLVLAGAAAVRVFNDREQQRVRATATAVAQAQATVVANMPGALRPLAERFGMAFVRVQPGEFTMGSPSGEGFDDERPQHTIYLDDFWIGATEVTNAQYRPFIEAGGYQQRELWTEAGWEWLEAGGIAQPACWLDRKWNQPDYPVVCVSWYEAVAYARWLAQETGLDVRLPTEAEWEKAARGTDGRMYPWGDEWDATRANTAEGGPDRTTPMGAYRAGASPYGALDMAGNVWEWTSSLYEDYPYRPDDGREEMAGSAHRVVRGGSWDHFQGLARSAYRGALPRPFVVLWAGDRYGYLGVRVVVAAPR